MASKSIMVQGTGSHVGKSIAVAAICRILKQDGYSVCPFKAQNMALNSFVTADGKEMGRAQVMQAEASGLSPEVFMNPILIKPVEDTRAQIIFMGEVVKNMTAAEYDKKKSNFLKKIGEIITSLKKRFDYVVIEGAGSPAEINLLENDIVNMSVAEISNSPVILLGDIDKGGIFASFYGTVKILPKKYQKLIKALMINKFRGDINLLKPGIDWIENKLGIPVLGTIPYYNNIIIDEEDSVNIERESKKRKNFADNKLNIAVLYLPHISNFTDFNCLEIEEDINLLYIKALNDLINFRPDLIIIPGSKNTISDLLYLEKSGFIKTIKNMYKSGVSVIGICGGYQMLGEKIIDEHGRESDIREANGLGFFDMETNFLEKKNTSQVKFGYTGGAIKVLGSNPKGQNSFTGYEIHMGISKVKDFKARKLFKINRRKSKNVDENDGYIFIDKKLKNLVMGTYIHGIFDNCQIRKEILEKIAKLNDLKINIDSNLGSYHSFKQKQYDRLADVFRQNMDMPLLYNILNK